MAIGKSERFTSRQFAVGPFVFAFSTATADDVALVESLFRDVEVPETGSPDPVIFSLLRKDADGRQWAIAGGRLGDLPPLDLQTALSLLMAEFNFAALDTDPEHLHLHAGLVAKDGRAVIVAADRNTGKTTTVAQLVARGWDYASDEMVRLGAETDDVLGVRKPLSIKPGGRDLVAQLEPWMIPPLDVGPDGFRFVPVSASGATVVNGGRPHLVILLRRRDDDDGGGGALAVPVHPADAVVAVMQEVMDAERFGAAASRLARLAATSHTYRLFRGTPAETADEIDRLAQLDPPAPVDVRILPASDAFTPGVVSIEIGDRMVVHDTATGRIFALDPGGTQIWQQLGGWSGGIDIDGPVIQPFVEQLRTLGVLAGTT